MEGRTSVRQRTPLCRLWTALGQNSGYPASRFGLQDLLRRSVVRRNLPRRFESPQRLSGDQLMYFRAVQDFALQQCQSDPLQRIRPLLDNRACPIVAVLHQLLDLLIDTDRGSFAVIAMLR